MVIYCDLRGALRYIAESKFEGFQRSNHHLDAMELAAHATGLLDPAHEASLFEDEGRGKLFSHVFSRQRQGSLDVHFFLPVVVVAIFPVPFLP